MEGDDLHGIGGEAHGSAHSRADVRTMGLLVGFPVQRVTVLGAEQIQIMHERAERERLLFGEGEAEPIGHQGRIETDAASMIEEVAVLGF